MNNKCKNSQTTKRHVGVNAGLCFNSKIFCLLGMLLLMTVVLQRLNNINNVQAKSLLLAKDKLKLLQSPSLSLIKLRQKRGTYANERQQAGDQNESDYYDDNYDVLPGGGGGENGPSATEGDQISEKAQQVAQSFKNMWQSLTDSVRHCIDALRAMFGEESDDEELTPEQEQQILAEMEERYRLKHQHDNEVIMNVYQNNL